MKNKTISTELLLLLFLTTFDTIEHLLNCIKTKVQEIEDEKPEENILLSLSPILNFCNHIETELEKAVNFYGLEKEG